MIQNVSNLHEEMEAKEPFMHPMNFLMPESVARVKSFILNLVQIDQKEGIASHDTAGLSHDNHMVQCLPSAVCVTVGTSTISSSVRGFCGRGTCRQVWEVGVSSTARDTLS